MNQQHLFLTGATGFIGKYFLQTAVKHFQKITLLVRKKSQSRAEEIVEKLNNPERVQLVKGDITRLIIGLSSKEKTRLSDEVTHLVHMAALYDTQAKRKRLFQTNVEGTKNILELAYSFKKLQVFGYMSTAYVAGMSEDKILESSLRDPKEFHNDYEESKFLAEKFVKEAFGELPTIIFRPSMVVGHSQTGEFGKLDGPYKLLALLNKGRLPAYPGPCQAPLHLVPVDYVAKVITHLLTQRDAVDKTFHLVDPQPWTVKKFIDRSAKLLGKREPLFVLPDFVIRNFPVGLVRRQLQVFNQEISFDCRNTERFLKSTSIQVPRLDEYHVTLVKSFLNHA